jgi:hypothetical protein
MAAQKLLKLRYIILIFLYFLSAGCSAGKALNTKAHSTDYGLLRKITPLRRIG